MAFFRLDARSGSAGTGKGIRKSFPGKRDICLGKTAKPQYQERNAASDIEDVVSDAETAVSDVGAGISDIEGAVPGVKSAWCGFFVLKTCQIKN